MSKSPRFKFQQTIFRGLMKMLKFHLKQTFQKIQFQIIVKQYRIQKQIPFLTLLNILTVNHKQVQILDSKSYNFDYTFHKQDLIQMTAQKIKKPKHEQIKQQRQLQIWMIFSSEEIIVDVDLFTKTDIPEEFDSFQNTSNPLQIANETLNNQTNYGAFKIFEEAKQQQQEDESLQESPSKEIKSFTCALLIPYMNSMLRLNTEQCLRKFGFKSVNYLDEEEEVIDFINNAKRMKQKLHLLIVPGDIGRELSETLSEIQNQCTIIGIQPISKENANILQKSIKDFDEKYLKKALSEVF